jgi:hypothetical protein
MATKKRKKKIPFVETTANTLAYSVPASKSGPAPVHTGCAGPANPGACGGGGAPTGGGGGAPSGGAGGGS